MSQVIRTPRKKSALAGGSSTDNGGGTVYVQVVKTFFLVRTSEKQWTNDDRCRRRSSFRTGFVPVWRRQQHALLQGRQGLA